MNVLPVCIVLISCALMKGCVEAIQCYTCDDCQALNDTLLQSCSPEESRLAVAFTTTARPEEVTTTTVPETTVVEVPKEPVTPVGTNATDDSSEAEDVAVESGESEVKEAVAVEDVGPDSEPSSLVSSPALTSSLDSPRIKRLSGSNPLSYRCFSIQTSDGRRMQTRKGCIEVPVKGSACAILKEKYAASEKNCKICSENKCNSGVVMKYSLAAAVLVIVNSLVQW